MTATWRLHAIPDRLPPGGPMPLRRWYQAALPLWARLRQSTLVWMLAMGGGTVLLAALVQAGVRLEQRALLQQRLGPVLVELAQQLEAGMAQGQRLAPGSPLQAPLDQALAQSRPLDTIIVLTPEGSRLMSAGAGLRPAGVPGSDARPDLLPVLGVSVPLHDAAGQRVGELLAQPEPAAAGPVLPPGALWLALGLPLLALAVALRAAWHHAAVGPQRARGPAVLPRWGLAFAVLTLAAGLLLAGAAGRLQGPLDQTAADPARRAALALALRVGHALDAGVPLQRLDGLNPLLRQRLRESPGVAEISVVDAGQSLLAIQAGPALADPRVPAEVAPVMHRGERVAEVHVQRAALRTPWLLLNMLGVASALVAVGLLLTGQDLRLQAPAWQRALPESMAGVLIGAALALTGAMLVRSDAALALAALAGPALLLLAACVVWRWGRAMAGQRLLAGALVATAWCLVQG